MRCLIGLRHLVLVQHPSSPRYGSAIRIRTEQLRVLRNAVSGPHAQILIDDHTEPCAGPDHGHALVRVTGSPPSSVTEKLKWCLGFQVCGSVSRYLWKMIVNKNCAFM